MVKQRKTFLLVGLLVLVALVLAACPAQPAAEPTVVEVTREVEKIVEKEVIKEVEVATEVEKIVEVMSEDYSTPHPILSDPKVRQAISHCINRDALIASVYPYVADDVKPTLRMDTFLPKSHWAYSGPYTDMPQYDPAAGAALLDEAGWTLADGAAVRTNAAGEALALKFTTTTPSSARPGPPWPSRTCLSAEFRSSACIPPPPGGSVTRRAWPAATSSWAPSPGSVRPNLAGRTLYACDQIPLPSNNWEGQNYMGWCNETANAMPLLRPLTRCCARIASLVLVTTSSRRSSPRTWSRSRSSSAPRPKPGARNLLKASARRHRVLHLPTPRMGAG